MEARKQDLTDRLAEPYRPLPRPRPNLAEIYRAKVATLRTALADDGAERGEAVELLRSLIEGVELRPTVEGDGTEIELAGDIVRMIDPGRTAKKPPRVGRLFRTCLRVRYRWLRGPAMAGNDIR